MLGGLEYGRLLEGGKGTKVALVNNAIPKPILPICGKPVLQHQIECPIARESPKLPWLSGICGSRLAATLGMAMSSTSTSTTSRRSSGNSRGPIWMIVLFARTIRTGGSRGSAWSTRWTVIAAGLNRGCSYRWRRNITLT